MVRKRYYVTLFSNGENFEIMFCIEYLNNLSKNLYKLKEGLLRRNRGRIVVYDVKSQIQS